MNVFYSWQSDTPAKVARTLIREALESAVADLDLEDAERPEIDQDTKGVLGSPVIAETIFKKIRHAKVVVADVTLTGQTPEGKRLCNSNVAIELGYALGIHGDEVLLKVMNTHYGPPQDLPFDLAHRRWPVEFNLSPDATVAERARVRAALTKELRKILELYITAASSTRLKESVVSGEAKKGDLRAAFVNYGRNYKLKINNRGPGSARNVRIEFPDGGECIIKSEVEEKFPLELLEPDESVELIAAIHLGSKRKHAVKLTWDDDKNLNNEKTVYATL